MAAIKITCWHKWCHNDSVILMAQPFDRGGFPACIEHALTPDNPQLFFFEEQAIAFEVLEKMTSDF